MDRTELTDRFYSMIAPTMPNEVDVDQSLAPLVEADDVACEHILAQVPAIWPVSHTLCFLYLANVLKAIPFIIPENLDIYAKELLDRHARGGFSSVLDLLDNPRVLLPRFRGKNGLRLEDVHARLQPYINGLAGKEIPLLAAGTSYTDTSAIYVPWEINLFKDPADGLLLYKFIASFQWASLAVGTLSVHGLGKVSFNGKHHPLQELFAATEDPLAFMQLFHSFETVRILSFLERELPGLMRDYSRRIRPVLLTQFSDSGNQDFIYVLQKRFLEEHAGPETELMKQVDHWMQQENLPEADRKLSLRAAEDISKSLIQSGEYSCEAAPFIFQGELRLNEIMEQIRQSRKKQHDSFLESFIEKNSKEQKTFDQDDNDTVEETLILVETEGEDDADDIALADIPEEQSKLFFPKAMPSFMDANNTGINDTKDKLSQFVYDEWDSNRNAFRKAWCRLTEHALVPVKAAFVEEILADYRLQIAMLKKQFERIQTGDRHFFRQQEGDDIDFDAVVESLADLRAGQTPSDRLFIRKMRDQRDVGVLFLVDMSSSTEGWVGRAIKEALILLSETMEKVNDQFGIYGFSGKTRQGCEIYAVKTPSEIYGETVRKRIAAIEPRGFTRMGAAIRHMTQLFGQINTGLRLLLVISDGKPQDSDDYKDDYAIEDTRHAVFEAMNSGIHPFCITIDEDAPTYMQHMFGPGNSIFVNDVRRLPTVMPKVYQTLTT